MRKLILGSAAALSLLGSAVAAEAAPLLVVGVDAPGDARLEKAQYIYLGHPWCWYDVGWHGPGWYWCGFVWRHGLGWGGPAGWRGWAYGPVYWRDGVWIGPPHYHHRDWHGWHWHGRH